MIKRKNSDGSIILGVLLFWGSIVVTLIAGWINNIIWLFHIDKFSWSGEQIISIIGTFLFPIGSIHGIYLWF
jgi:hypothetical protein